MDSFKIFLSLYGHKLPVLCMDISLDGAFLVTGSTDKNLKIWVWILVIAINLFFLMLIGASYLKGKFKI